MPTHRAVRSPRTPEMTTGLRRIRPTSTPSSMPADYCSAPAPGSGFLLSLVTALGHCPTNPRTQIATGRDWMRPISYTQIETSPDLLQQVPMRIGAQPRGCRLDYVKTRILKIAATRHRAVADGWLWNARRVRAALLGNTDENATWVTKIGGMGKVSFAVMDKIPVVQTSLSAIIFHTNTDRIVCATFPKPPAAKRTELFAWRDGARA